VTPINQGRYETSFTEAALSARAPSRVNTTGPTQQAEAARATPIPAIAAFIRQHRWWLRKPPRMTAAITSPKQHAPRGLRPSHAHRSASIWRIRSTAVDAPANSTSEGIDASDSPKQ
jgi:hypothetical protein